MRLFYAIVIIIGRVISCKEVKLHKTLECFNLLAIIVKCSNDVHTDKCVYKCINNNVKSNTNTFFQHAQNETHTNKVAV